MIQVRIISYYIKEITLLTALFFLDFSAYGQGAGSRFSSVNPVLFLYTADDIYINTPSKYNNGNHLLRQNQEQYPWEDRWDNGYPNAFVAPDGNVSLYLSIYDFFDPDKISSSGSIEFLRTNNSLSTWERPDLGVLYYNGGTSPPKDRVNRMMLGVNTNLVAKGLEVMGMTKDLPSNTLQLVYRLFGKTAPNMPIFNGHTMNGYSANADFDNHGAFSIFTSIPTFDSEYNQVQYNFNAPFLSADTHNQLFSFRGENFFTTRLRVKSHEPVPAYQPNNDRPSKPTSGDEHRLYRRSYIVPLGSEMQNSSAELIPALDPQPNDMEPYSLQAFRLPGFESDILWGLVTMYDNACNSNCWTDPDWDTQWTELAISADGRHWKYLKPGEPFIPNGHQQNNTNADDQSTVNIALPVSHTQFHSPDYPEEQYYFYMSSKEKHKDDNRVAGLSLAKGDYGKMAGLKTTSAKTFASMNPKNSPLLKKQDLIHIRFSSLFTPGAEVKLGLLTDVSSYINSEVVDPNIPLASYVRVDMYAYDEDEPLGQGTLLAGAYGNSQTNGLPSRHYETVPFSVTYHHGTEQFSTISNSKSLLFNHLWNSANKEGDEKIVTVNDFDNTPVLLEAEVKDAVHYGIELETDAVNTEAASQFTPPNPIYSFYPSNTTFGILNRCSETKQDQSIAYPLPNQIPITELGQGTIAIKVKPSQSHPETDQYVFGLWGDDSNHLALLYGEDGNYHYRLRKDGIDFVKRAITPSNLGLTSFAGETATITIENTNTNKYHKGGFPDPIPGTAGEQRNIVPNLRVKVGETNYIVVPFVDFTLPNIDGSLNAKDTADARISYYDLFASFIPELKYAVVGYNDQCNGGFIGDIFAVEFATELPEIGEFYNQDINSVSSFTQNVSHSQESFGEELMVYPNPALDQIQVAVPWTDTESLQITLLDMNGRRVATLWDRNMTAGSNHFSFQLNAPPGLYLVVVESGFKRTVKKLIISQ